MAFKVFESALVASAASAGYADLSPEQMDFELIGEADTSSKRVMGRRVPKKEWTRRRNSISLNGYMADMPNMLDKVFHNLEVAMIAFYHEKAGRFSIGDYNLENVELVDDEGIYVLNGTAIADGRVYWGHLISAMAGTTTAITDFEAGWVMVHVKETNAAGTLTIRFTSNSRNYDASITNAEGLYFLQPMLATAVVPAADKNGDISAIEAGGIDADYVWGWVA